MLFAALPLFLLETGLSLSVFLFFCRVEDSGGEAPAGRSPSNLSAGNSRCLVSQLICIKNNIDGEAVNMMLLDVLH